MFPENNKNFHDEHRKKKRFSGTFRDSEPEIYQINHLFSRSISVLQSSSGQLKI